MHNMNRLLLVFLASAPDSSARQIFQGIFSLFGIIKGYVADFIIAKVFFIETASKSKSDSYGPQQQRMYAYYKKLLDY